MERVLLFLKGICMGIADVIPGVSGGTLALILGIYRELVDSIRGLNLRWVAPLGRFMGRRDQESRAELAESLRAMNLPFLVVLGAGIATALVIGSLIIPTLMENFPVAMRALFFGLILASVFVPFRMLRGEENPWRPSVLVLGVLGLVAGWVLTDPGQTLEVSREWVSVEVAEAGESLEDAARRGPSSVTTEELYWAPENEALRRAMQVEAPGDHAKLMALRAAAGEVDETDKKALKARAVPYDEVVLPAGAPLQVPRPAFWFIFVAGAIAICAMILPGISGSYLLLIMGVYFFVLNAIKGLLVLLAGGTLSVPHLLYVGLFGSGIVVGILSFARVLSYLLHYHPAKTLAVLVGLMLGCLRGIWPFRATVGGVVRNAFPASFDGQVASALAAFALGVVVVAALSWVGRERTDETIDLTGEA